MLFDREAADDCRPLDAVGNISSSILPLSSRLLSSLWPSRFDSEKLPDRSCSGISGIEEAHSLELSPLPTRMEEVDRSIDRSLDVSLLSLDRAALAKC